MKMVLLGAPGAGKGTQADLISAKLHIPTISTGNLLRTAMKNGTEIGEKVKEYMDGGKLVPDALIIDLVRQRVAQDDCKAGVILDGFPRTQAQAVALGEIMDVDVALSIEVNDEEIEHRMAGRRICTKCQATYHVEDNPPKQADICDKCGSPLAIRKDDTQEVVDKRLQIYHRETEPIKKYYRQKGILVEVRGQKALSETTRQVFGALGISQ